MNANTQHTPAPWTLLEEGEELLNGSTSLTICGPQDDDLANVYSSADATVNISRPEAVANAQLIAAAPDLFGFSLEIQCLVRSSGANLCSTATEPERSAFISGILDAWNNGGYDAIAKATGVAS